MIIPTAFKLLIVLSLPVSKSYGGKKGRALGEGHSLLSEHRLVAGSQGSTIHWQWPRVFPESVYPTAQALGDLSGSSRTLQLRCMV
jgi:hypothetical protein